MQEQEKTFPNYCHKGWSTELSKKKMSWYDVVFILPFTGTKGTRLYPETQPQSILLPLPALLLALCRMCSSIRIPDCQWREHVSAAPESRAACFTPSYTTLGISYRILCRCLAMETCLMNLQRASFHADVVSSVSWELYSEWWNWGFLHIMCFITQGDLWCCVRCSALSCHAQCIVVLCKLCCPWGMVLCKL